MNIDEIDRDSSEWDPLWVLFGAFLNQDMSDDYGSVWDATGVFRAEARAAEVLGAARAAQRLATETSTEAEAELAVEKLGLEYNPPGDGYGYRQWLDELARFLGSKSWEA